jgi:8-oxo-dGTP pyrophosphatase MutT (NUDIX family)
MAEAPTHAGIAVQAADTGRVLMIQRSLDPTDPPEVQGTWEFPGGSLENGESPEDGAWREFCEETGLPKPKGETVTSWTSPDGVYQGFVHVVPVEATAFDELNPDRQAASTVNPDDPKGERPEVTAWFDPEHVRNLGAALRPEVADMDWSVFDRGNPTTESWQALTAFHQLFETLPVTQQILAAQLVEGAPGHGNEARLKRWWLTSSGIHWGVGGDFDSCVRKATDIFGRHGVAIDPKRWCAALHKEFTGASPGHAPGEHHESAEETPMGDDDLRLVETVTITESAAQEARATGEFPIQFITPGWGSSGYYSPQTIAEAASERVIPKGTHMYADHPTDAEFKARPARSIKDLMAVTTEDARLSSRPSHHTSVSRSAARPRTSAKASPRAARAASSKACAPPWPPLTSSPRPDVEAACSSCWSPQPPRTWTSVRTSTSPCTRRSTTPSSSARWPATGRP